MPVYASGISPGGAADTVLFSREAGYRAFKLKVGFGMEQDLANLDQGITGQLTLTFFGRTVEGTNVSGTSNSELYIETCN